MSVWQTLGGTPRRRDVTTLVSLAATAIFSLYLLSHEARSATLHLVNGLDIAVVVECEGRSAVVPAQSKSQMTLSNGPHLATTKSAAGNVLERAVVVADSHSDAVVYNVLGAAPLLEARVHYTSGPQSRGRDDDVTFLGGRRLSVVADLDYVLTDPPKSISSDKSSGEIVKRALLLPAGGAAGTTSFLLGGGRAAEAVELQRTMLGVDPTSLRTINYVCEASFEAYGGDEAVISLIAPIVRGTSADTDDLLARFIVSEGCRYDCDDALRIVGEASVKDPLKRKLTLLRGRAETDVRAELAELAARHGDDPELLRAQGWLLLVDGKYSECAALFARAGGAPNAGFDVEERSLCLHAAGRHAEALEVAARVADSGGDAVWMGALSYARLAMAAGEPATTYLDKLEQDPARQAAARGIWLGMFDRKAAKPVEDGAVAGALAIALAASEGVEPALELVRKKPGALRQAPDALAIILGGELALRGEIAAAERVLAASRTLRLSARGVIDYVLRGTVPRLMFRIHPEHRAALDFVRGRRLDQLGQDSRPLYASARKRDVLQGWVHRLMKAWPAPERANDVLVYTPPPG